MGLCNRAAVDADGGTSSGSYYFRDKKCTFQGVRGRFKLGGVPMSECVTVQVFHRPAGLMNRGGGERPREEEGREGEEGEGQEGLGERVCQCDTIVYLF